MDDAGVLGDALGVDDVLGARLGSAPAQVDTISPPTAATAMRVRFIWILLMNASHRSPIRPCHEH